MITSGDILSNIKQQMLDEGMQADDLLVKVVLGGLVKLLVILAMRGILTESEIYIIVNRKI
jgi:hypothetical protein